MTRLCVCVCVCAYIYIHTIETMARIKLNSVLVYSMFTFNCGAWALAETEA